MLLIYKKEFTPVFYKKKKPKTLRTNRFAEISHFQKFKYHISSDIHNIGNTEYRKYMGIKWSLWDMIVFSALGYIPVEL